MTDSVAVDAKRILLRYGAPIAILDKVSESHRIEFARKIAKTMLPAREPRLRELLAEYGYIDAETLIKRGKGRKARAAAPAPADGGKPKSGKPKSSEPKSSESKSGKPKSDRPRAAKKRR